MAKDKLKNLLDFVPLTILTVNAGVLIWTISTTNIILQSEHYIGLTLLVMTILASIKTHKLLVLLLGLIILLGVFKIVSFSAIIMYYAIGGSLNGHSSGDIKIQPLFLLWLFIHLLVSGRHYIGIFTTKYWRDLFDALINKKIDEDQGNQ